MLRRWGSEALKFGIKYVHQGQISTVDFVKLCWVETSISENIAFEMQAHYYDSKSVCDRNNDVEKWKFQLRDYCTFFQHKSGLNIALYNYKEVSVFLAHFKLSDPYIWISRIPTIIQVHNTVHDWQFACFQQV